MKKLLPLILTFFLISTSVTVLADNTNTDSITVKNNGMYMLKVRYNDPQGKRQSRLMDGQHPTMRFLTAQNSDIHLTAVAGKSTHLVSKNSGIIKCTGTTLIGFKCKYIN